MSTPISIVGTIATDPKFFTTQSGAPLCSFRVASNERRFDRDTQTWVDGETNWFGVTAFRGLAEHVSRSVRKGDRIVVQGRLRIRSWESGEKKGISVDIEAEALGHDLRWGTSMFTKTALADDGAKPTLDSAAETGRGAGPDSWATTPDPEGSQGDGGAVDEADEGAMNDDGFLPAAA